MLLSCRFLIDVAGVNSFEYANTVEFYFGDSQSVYLQLIDASLDRNDQGFSPAGRRYMPAAGATLEVTLNSVDDAKKLVRTATQPFVNDPSIWLIPILSTDTIKGTVHMKLRLVDGSKIFNSNLVPGFALRVR
jgi:hypothetical protein